MPRRSYAQAEGPHSFHTPRISSPSCARSICKGAKPYPISRAHAVRFKIHAPSILQALLPLLSGPSSNDPPSGLSPSTHPLPPKDLSSLRSIHQQLREPQRASPPPNHFLSHTSIYPISHPAPTKPITQCIDHDELRFAAMSQLNPMYLPRPPSADPSS
ncbi:hypothetical protein BDN70DRAFT_495661 [Pholiota conissans]|uniref:Uncharacterized protein n=1 Tax=Pholiota conissans TaxID=109636 RepID=A0A9P6CTK4_9AGAR|nr:hypothetical protein BDN70DRAFT_495661 [Pholiota conissans]